MKKRFKWFNLGYYLPEFIYYDYEDQADIIYQIMAFDRGLA